MGIHKLLTLSASSKHEFKSMASDPVSVKPPFSAPALEGTAAFSGCGGKVGSPGGRPGFSSCSGLADEAADPTLDSSILARRMACIAHRSVVSPAARPAATTRLARKLDQWLLHAIPFRSMFAEAAGTLQDTDYFLALGMIA